MCDENEDIQTANTVAIYASKLSFLTSESINYVTDELEETNQVIR